MATRRTMPIVRRTLIGLAGSGAAGVLSVALFAGGQAKPPMPSRAMPMHGTATMTTDQKIANAMTAAPSAVSAGATVLDWPAKDGDAPPVLRSGTNGWTCLPDMPGSDGNDP